jgi:hypothetical protein
VIEDEDAADDEAKEIPDIAVSILQHASELGVPSDWVTDPLVKYAFEDVSLERGREVIEGEIDSMAAIKNDANPAVAHALVAALRASNYDASLIGALATAGREVLDTAPRGSRTWMVSGSTFQIDRPTIVCKQPSTRRSTSYFPGRGQVATLELGDPSEASFGFTVGVHVIPQSPHCLAGWRIGIIQDVKGRRVASYGAKRWGRVFNRMMDSSQPPWFKGMSWELSKFREGGTMTIYNPDAPTWSLPTSRGPVGEELSNVEVADEFNSYLVVQTADGSFVPLFRQEWEFTGNMAGVRYVTGPSQVLAGDDAAGLITADKPRAQDHRDKDL